MINGYISSKKTDAVEKKPNLVLMYQYLYAIPGNNTNFERIFSLIVIQRTQSSSNKN